MLKYHKLISLCFGLLFLVVMQKFATPLPVFRFLLPAFLLYAALLTWYNRWYLLQLSQYNFWLNLRPMLLVVGAFGIFLAVPAVALRDLFLFLAVATITGVEMVLGNLAENIMLNETLLIAFGLFFAGFAAYFYFPGYQPLYVIGIFAGSTLLARSFYEIVPRPGEVKLLGAAAIGLFCSELYWTLNFLPPHYSVFALLLLNVFYFCLILNYYYLFHLLNFKKIKFHLYLVIFCSALVVLATPWHIITS